MVSPKERITDCKKKKPITQNKNQETKDHIMGQADKLNAQICEGDGQLIQIWRPIMTSRKEKQATQNYFVEFPEDEHEEAAC